MKTEIIETEKKEIDWSKPGLVKCPDGKLYVLTDGVSVDDIFSGTVLHDFVRGYKSGHYSSLWEKDKFEPITEPITIKFTP